MLFRSGLSGLDVSDGVQACVADSAEAMARAAADLLADPARAQALGQAARAHVTARFDWGAAAAQLEAAHEACLGMAPQAPGGAP